MPDDRVFVIAEAGVNHNGDPELARALVDAAASAGADAVKFQTFAAERVATRGAPKAAYQRRRDAADESQFAMLKRLELAPTLHLELAARARKAGIEFMSTPFDEEAATFLARDLGVSRIKVPSGEITNGPFLLHVARLGLPIILSTGASTLEEIADALGVIAFGFADESGGAPDIRKLAEYFEQGATRVRERVTVLQCTTEYPAPAEDANLRAMLTISMAFGVSTGLSDHTSGAAIAIAAAALGAGVIEKHFTLDRTLPGPDHAASLQPAELRDAIVAIRQVEASLGDGVKRVAPPEAANRAIVRRSLTALADIRQGEPFTKENLGARRPGTGVSAMRYWEYIDRPARRAYSAGELIDA